MTIRPRSDRRYDRALPLIAALTAAPLLIAAAPAQAAPGPVRYAALGDSFAAGAGAGQYDPASGACHRSARSYPQLWSSAHGPADFLFAACSGALTADVLRDQVPRVPADAGLVTLTIGGNDLAFGDAAVACLQPFTTDGHCDRALDESERRLREELPDRLATLYRALDAQAPAARVVVTGYPHLLGAGASCPVAPEPRRARFNALTDRLDDLIEAQAAKQGFHYADVRAAFDGHEACKGAAGEWIHPVTLPLWESFHPKAEGQVGGYLPSVSDAALG
ncbi:SGNH/GDSL hydrolase family protein [Kitasatospora paranensis]|uniref:SGNH/GDSL hydrolase family protein n=1 Tax=Kitasatospora paranensis TaxID=258053 RepID=UPI0031E93C3B